MSSKLNETQIKAALQLAVLYDVQDSVHKVSDTPSSTKTKKIAEWLKKEDPTLFKALGLDELLSPFGKMKSPTFHPEAYRKLGMDSLPLTANGGFGSPAFHADAYNEIGLQSIKTDAMGKISPLAFQNPLLGRLGIEAGGLNSLTSPLSETFKPPGQSNLPDLRAKFLATPTPP